MNITTVRHHVLAALLALVFAPGAIASSHCGMNSNKPCPDTTKSSAKEPAYKSMNSNKPAAMTSSAGGAASGVKSADGAPQPARATLSGISGNQLKLKPKPVPTSEKEPAK